MSVTTDYFYPLGYVLINQQIANNSTSIDFPNFVSGSYSSYRIIIEDYSPTIDATSLNMRVSNNIAGAPWDSGANNYYYARRIMDNGGFSVAGSASTLIQISSLLGNATTRQHNALIYFYSPNSNTVSPIHWNTWQVGSTTFNSSYCGAMRNSTNFVSVQFFMSSGNIAKGKFSIYGLKL